MADIINKETLIKEQYNDSKNLYIRVYIHEKFSTNKQGFMRWLFEQIEIKDEYKVLELGCGTGLLWTVNAERLNSSVEFTLSDISMGMVAEAKKRITYQNFNFQQIDVENIPFDNDKFDIIIANHMLYHVPNIDKALSEIKRVLKKSGTFYASTIGENNMDELRKIVNDFMPEINYPFTRDLIKFNLQNGYGALNKYFNLIKVKKYEDSLMINETAPLVEYVLSLKGWGNISEMLVNQRLKEFSSYINEKIQKAGNINISKEAGIFIAKHSD
jgi:ubiquinone/menaquinone biosynthesis C-methylase UbiE